MLTVGGRSGLGWAPELTALCRRAQEPAAARQRSNPRPPAPVAAPPWDRGAAFQVHGLLAQEHSAPPPRREVILAAYRAHLAGRVRYFGPLAPVDLRV